MHPRLSAARFAGALTSLAFIAACSDHGSSPTTPLAASNSAAFNNAADPGQGEVLSRAVIHRTLEATEHARQAAGHRPGGGGSVELTYHGGVGGIGVETAPKVYLVIWGSQWNSNDPSGEQSHPHQLLRLRLRQLVAE